MTIFIRTRRFFSVFPFFRFTFYVFPFPLMLMHMLYAHAHPHSKTKHQRHFHRHLFTLRFFVFFFRLLSISWLVVHVVFSSFVHPHFKKTKQTHVNFSSFESLIRPLSHQHHSAIYTFYNHESPSFYESTKKKNK